jgi:HEAT repeat protein
MDDKVLTALRRDLANPDRMERQNALTRIGDLAPEGGIDWVIPLVSDEDVHVRIDALLCLSALRDGAAIPLLIEALEHTRGEEQEYAVIALRRFTSPLVKNALLTALGNPAMSNVGRMHAALQLWRYSDDDSIKALKGAVLKDTDRNVRLHATDSLSFLFRALGEPPEWRSFWEQIRNDPVVGVSEFAEDALRSLDS